MFWKAALACGQQRLCPRNRIRGNLNIAGFASLHLFLRFQIKLNDLRVGGQTPAVKGMGRHACADAQNNLGPSKWPWRRHLHIRPQRPMKMPDHETSLWRAGWLPIGTCNLGQFDNQFPRVIRCCAHTREDDVFSVFCNNAATD